MTLRYQKSLYFSLSVPLSLPSSLPPLTHTHKYANSPKLTHKYLAFSVFFPEPFSSTL